MKELSIFVDESGDFGKYNHICPYYIVTLVTHEQANTIDEQVKKLNFSFGISHTNIKVMHTAPLIRREGVQRFRYFRQKKNV